MILRSQPDSLFSILLMREAEILVAVVRLLRGLHHTAHRQGSAAPNAVHGTSRARLSTASPSSLPRP